MMVRSKLLVVLPAVLLLSFGFAQAQTLITACGRYHGNLRLDADLTATSNCIIIDGDNTTLDGCAAYTGGNCTSKHSISVSGAASVQVLEYSNDVVIKNISTNARIKIDGVAALDCSSDRTVKRVTISNINSTGGGIDVTQACDITIQNNVLSGGGIGISSAYAMTGPYTVRNNTIDYNVFNSSAAYFFNVKELTFDQNQLHGNFYLESNWGRATNVRITNNNLMSEHGLCDTHDVFRVKTLENSLVDHNVIESRAQQDVCPVTNANIPAVVAKLYTNTNTVFSYNRIFSNNITASYGAIELRSSNIGNTFYRNEFVVPVAGSSAMMSHFSNQCCDAEGYFPPLDQNHCTGAGGGTSYGYCCNPADGNYRAPYTSPCHQRHNVWDSNLLYGGESGVWHYGDSRDNTFKNNVIVGKYGITAGGCEAGTGFTYYYNNTIHGTTAALRDMANCAIQARNNIFFSNGAASIVPSATGFDGSEFQGDYNLFWPNYNSSQAHPRTGNPGFVNATAADPFQRDYRLSSSSSPARNAGDPATAATPMSITVDRVGQVRPDAGGLADIGAYEYGSVPVDPNAPAAPANLRTQ
ncbi:MAG: right-handed parallel beta-helix repeat-containing protein [Oligoflexia bacterium]|nr:right-handed parallel beta-helix repeat-containing protein [Oligoflexia bacterium]